MGDPESRMHDALDDIRTDLEVSEAKNNAWNEVKGDFEEIEALVGDIKEDGELNSRLKQLVNDLKKHLGEYEKVQHY